MLFEVSSRNQLARLLAVSPGELNHLLNRLDRYYRPIKIRKRDGTFRQLLVPQGKLKLLQDKINRHILEKFPFLPCVHGGVRGRSVRSNALPHVRKPVVFSVDIRDFFPHVSPARVFRIFTGLGFGQVAARILTRLTTWRHQLPQGAPTSTTLANLSLVRVDHRISKLAYDQRFSYTRYVDDLTISGGGRLPKFRNLVQRIIESEGFQVKPEKKTTMHNGARQVVTQLVVNEKLNLPREKRRLIRQRVIDLMTCGGTQATRDSLLGQLCWVRYVNPEVGDKLFKLARRALSTSAPEGARAQATSPPETQGLSD